MQARDTLMNLTILEQTFEVAFTSWSLEFVTSHMLYPREVEEKFKGSKY